MHFGHIFAIRFTDCQHRLTRSELTANIKNIQIFAEICKEQTQIKNADTKTLIDNLQFAECNQLHKSPSSKYGGGGARAAWRIRIRRPRLAERGARGVSDTSADFCRLQSLRRTPPYPPTAPGMIAFADPQTQNFRFLADFLPIENSSKIRPLKTRPKTSKVGPLIAQTSILRSLLGAILAWIFMKFLISSKSAKTQETL